jgi:glycerophosphoryl diester phosphodiesterase
MKINSWFILFIILAMTSCQKNRIIPVPDTSWSLFNSPDAGLLSPNSRRAMEGIYHVTDGADEFGNEVALKWSYVAEGTDTSYNLSFFCSKGVSFFVVQAKVLADSILLNGYWRKLMDVETGKARFIINNKEGAKQLLSPTPAIGKDSILISGLTGSEDEQPAKKITLNYDRPLYNGSPLEILAHRAGGSSSLDFLPVTENSIGMIKFSSQMGATGIEIDIAMTKDWVPILYHDETLNLRLVQKSGLVGKIGNYTYDQLNTFARLTDGEHIPTLNEALETALNQTNLRLVWLDVKDCDSLQIISGLQSEYLQKAAAAGRSIQILIGLPNEDEVNKFIKLPNYASIPSLCELSLDEVNKINAKVWAPRWTLGLQNQQVAENHSAGKKAFVWTLDVPDYIHQFIGEGNFDGILSDYSPLIAYYYYAKQ